MSPDPSFNPAAEAFKSFDQTSSMMGSLHLDTDDEPRRGASRANSVRFDESAIHGHFGQASRSANEFYPSRSGSAFGSHPLLERSLSHKSEGRQSSTHSARASSFGVESRPLSATVPSFVPSGPPPGLFILGPVPSIIRCWLNTDFSTDSLLYAVVCTGSYKSLVNMRLLQQLNYQRQITLDTEGRRIIKLPVYLPEATIQQSSSRSSSPAPQLPTLTVEFVVQDSNSQSDSIDIFIGCDVLRFRNADIHFSLDRLTLFDDERNKVSVPLVRPENASIFQKLQTNIPYAPAGSVEPKTTAALDSGKLVEKPQPTASQTGEETANAQTKTAVKESFTPSPTSPSTSVEYPGPGRENEDATAPEPTKPAADSKETDQLRNGSTPDTPTRPESSNIWGSWRRDSLQGNRPEGVSTSTGSSSTYNRAGRGRGMKVLKPARLNTSRTSSSQAPVGFDAAPSRFGDGSRSAGIRNNENKSPGTGKSFSSEKGQLGSGKLNTSNPIGGASAFGWLNPAQKSSALHD